MACCLAGDGLRDFAEQPQDLKGPRVVTQAVSWLCRRWWDICVQHELSLKIQRVHKSSMARQLATELAVDTTAPGS